MTPFDFITVALSLVLGLGITLLLTSAVQMFRSRDKVPLDWVALGWAAVILLWQLQYWWATYELSTLVKTWTMAGFGLMVLLALLLFVAGALILPPADQGNGDRGNDAFARNGRWALVVLSAYFGLGIVANRMLFNSPILSTTNLVVTGQLLAPLLFLLIRNRRLQLVAVAGCFLLSLWAAAAIAPTAY